MSMDAAGLWLGRALMAGFAALVVAELIRYFRTALVEPAVAISERPWSSPRRRLPLRSGFR